MVLGGSWRNEEAFPDEAVAEFLAKQRQHVPLAPAEPGQRIVARQWYVLDLHSKAPQ